MALRLVPLGGLGEIGKNCLAVEAGRDIVVVDCGVTFGPRELGVDVQHPDFAWLLERREWIRGVVLTHGHEDHIGGVPYLLRELDVPVYGPRYALALVQRRLEEHGLEATRLIETSPGARVTFGHIEVEPISVTHSIPDAHALAIRTADGLVVHSGDFKIEQEPGPGERFDAARFGELGHEGVRVLLSDSTNSGVAGSAESEGPVARAIERLVRGGQARVVVALFASNVRRLGAVFAAAEASGRKVVALGRSMLTHIDTAVRTGRLRDPSAVLIRPEQAAVLARHEVVYLATGTQGEPTAALARLARAEHHLVALEAGDRVVLSSRVIPGHELEVARLCDAFLRMGVEVHTAKSDPDVHASGHACMEEQRRMIELTEPRGFVPIHGTLTHLREHADLARSMGIGDVACVENGAPIEVHPGALGQGAPVRVGAVAIDALERLDDEVLGAREALGRQGVVVVTLRVGKRGRLAGRPTVVAIGVTDRDDAAELAATLARRLSEELTGDVADALEHTRRYAARFFERELGRRPFVEVAIDEGNG